ncbi:MAG: histidinol dehydrogenase [Dehalococcoidales bacterium]|nr:histidinol dehydrogenase [Dehalococcoidales bacterium]RLC60092.1 MAG: histidinol dehydrogenase [Chloroflexota bacterium]
MKRIKGFDQAKQVLDRKDPLKSLDIALEQQQVVANIIGKVRSKGDKALFRYAKELEDAQLDSLEVSQQEISAAYDAADKKLISALELAAERIREFHLACLPKTGVISIDPCLGRQVRPLNKVGIYTPGGTACYPSTVLMTAIPAKVAGVGQLIMASPPRPNGAIPAATLVAANIAQVDRIFKIGGAQAIAALAFGTESVPKVDKICGPGNIFVMLAKMVVYGEVGVDGLQGPSEIVIVADSTADASLCTAELLAQAEHDPLAKVFLITTFPELADKVDEEISLKLDKLKRSFIVAEVLDSGMIVLVDDIDQAVELVNLYAPEHLSLMVSDASSLIPRIYNAGSIFVGDNSSVVFGDYVAGPSHVLPTGGSARFSSPLGVEDFLKVTNIISLDDSTVRELSQPAITIAEAEGFNAHAQAVSLRAKRSNHGK